MGGVVGRKVKLFDMKVACKHLRIYIELLILSDLLMRTHVQRTVSWCMLCRQLRQIRRSVPTDTFQTLVESTANTSGFRQQRVGRSSGSLGPPTQIKSNQNQIKIYIAPYVHEDSEALGGWITCSRRVGIDEFLNVF